jgi:hypothetical protein
LKITYLFLIMFILIIGKLNATIYYVDADSGSDGNSGTSENSAWQTLDKINNPRTPFNANDIISFKCGTRIVGQTLVPPSSYLKFNSYGSGSRPVIDGDSLCNCINIDTKSYITFNDLKFVNGYSGGASDPSSNVNMWKCSHITFESCNIDSSKGGHIRKVNLYDGLGNYLVIRNCTLNYGVQIDTTGNLGIYLDGTDNSLLEHDTLIGNYSNVRLAFGDDHGMANNDTIRYCVIKYGR